MRLRLFSPREAAAAAAAHDRCAAAGGLRAGRGPAGGRGAAQAVQQQVELVMSPQAQLWLFNKVAANSKDPSAAFSKILGQIQAHFQTAALSADEEEEEGGDEEEGGAE